MYIILYSSHYNIIKVQTPNADSRTLSRGQPTIHICAYLKIIFNTHAQQKQLCNNIIYSLREPLSPKSICEFRHGVYAPRWRR